MKNNLEKMIRFPKKWWQKMVVYQVYPRSFNDSNGDGIGDLRGIIEKLDYLEYLGVKMLWLNPVYKSPNDDNGYDVSDFYDIMDEFGTMADYDELLEKAHSKGIKIVMDLVVNHTSDEHPWFVESRASKESPYRDYYIWADPKADGSVPTNWGSFFGTPCWTLDEESGQYYMHIFSKKMPDLNWENENMRSELYDAINYWLNKGIDGFRLDAIPHIARNKNWIDAENPNNLPFVVADENYANLPEVHDYVAEMVEQTFAQHDVFTVGEAASAGVEEGIRYTDPKRGEVNAIIHFHYANIDGDNSNPQISGKWNKKAPDFMKLQSVMKEWTDGLYGNGWPTLFLNNHDMPRMVGRFGSLETAELRRKSAKMLATMMYLQWGIPFMLQGEEIGMTSPVFENINQYRDTEVFNFYRQFLDLGKTEEEALYLLSKGSRDGSRTPMQWSSDENGGFTTGTPWIDLNKDYDQWNVESQINDPDSILNYYRKVIRMKQEDDLYIYGTCEYIETGNAHLYIYKREWLERCAYVVVNTSSTTQQFKIEDLAHLKIVLSNNGSSEFLKTGTLQPYDAIVIE